MKKLSFIKLLTTKKGIVALTSTIALSGLVTYNTLSTGVLKQVSEKAALVEQNLNDSSKGREVMASLKPANSSNTTTKKYKSTQQRKDLPTKKENYSSNKKKTTVTKPSAKPSTKPSTKPSAKPSVKPITQPSAKPNVTPNTNNKVTNVNTSKSPIQNPINSSNNNTNNINSRSLLGDFTAKQELPSWAYNKTINVIHGSLTYWNWTTKDKAYVDSMVSNLTNEHKETLFNELFTLQSAYNSYLDKYIPVNGFRFYPSAVVGSMDSLGRAIKARYIALFNTNNYEYPAVGKSGFLDVSKSATLLANDNNNGNFEADKELYNVLIDFPYNKIPYQNMPVYSSPFKFSDDVVGFVPAVKDEIFISAYYGDSPNVFYHELGHMFEKLYQPNKEEYLAIRKNKPVNNQYFSSFEENFAEDFRYVKYPYANGKQEHDKSFGNPTPEEVEKLKTFFDNLEKSKNPLVRAMKVNGKYVLNEVIATDTNKVSFEGQSISDSITVLTPSGKTTYISSNGSYIMQEEGVYEFRTPYGKYTVVYDADKTLEIQEDSIWEEVQMSSLSGNAYHWTQNNVYAKGLFAYDKEQFLVMISTGQTDTFNVKNIYEENGKIIVDMEEGSRQTFVFRLSKEYKNMPIELRGQTLNIESETSSRNIEYDYDYNNMTYTKEEGIVLSGKARSSTGSLYYEMLDASGNVLHSNTISLSASAPHYSRFMDFVSPSEFPTGELTITFYESSAKTKQIDEVKVNIVD